MSRPRGAEAMMSEVRGRTEQVGWARLWFAVLGGPVLWTAHLLLSYALVPVACATGLSLPIHLVTLATGLPIVAAIVLAIGISQRSGASRRTRWLGLAGVLLGGMSLLATLLEGMPALVLGPCW